MFVPFVKAVTPVYFIGDSNVLVFRHLQVDRPEFFAQPVVTTASFVPGLSATTICHDGALHERVNAFVRQEILVRPIDAGVETGTRSEHAYRRQLSSTHAPPFDDEWNVPADPIVVLMVGTIDLLALVTEIGPATDFFCDDPFFESDAFPHPNLPFVPATAVQTLIERRLAPLGPAIASLQAIGITRLYLHSLAPPTLDDAAYYRARGAMCSAKLRYKIALAINRIFRRMASETGTGYVDLWNRTTKRGVRDERFTFDVDHLNRTAAGLTLDALLRDTIARRARPFIDSDGELPPF